MIYRHTTGGTVVAYGSWREVHSQFFDIPQYPMATIGDSPTFSVPWMQWVHAFCATCFFVMFGTSMDLVHFYNKKFRSFINLFIRQGNEQCGSSCGNSNGIDLNDIEFAIPASTSDSDVYVLF